MKYLFGDSTPFPISENFLETACAANETAVTLLRADEIRVEERRRVMEIEDRTESELAHFGLLTRRVDETYANPHDELRVHMRNAARSHVASLREEILTWEEKSVAKALETAALSKVLPAIGGFFERFQLPGTEWSLAWGARLDGNGTAVAQVHGRAPGDLDVSYDVAIPTNHAWSKPVRISVIERGVKVHLTRKRIFRKPRVELESLDSLFVTELIDLPGETTMTLRRSAKKPSAGLRIVIVDEPREVHVSRIGADGARTAEPELMEGEDATKLRRLFALLRSELRALVVHRKKVRAAYFRGIAVQECEEPAAMGTLFIESIAPYVREIARRSNGRHELALKRTLGDGRREELFVSYSAVLQGVDALEPAHRGLFEALGLAAKPVRVLPNLAPMRMPLPSDAEMTIQRPIAALRASA